MKNYTVKSQYVEVRSLKSITCDICKKVYDGEDYVETQEFLHINFTGGYGSIFGDMKTVECDICQHCLMKMIKGKYRITNDYSCFS
jgi:hypothetical protein